MKRALSFVLVSSLATVFIGSTHAEAGIHRCFGKSATLVGTLGNDVVLGLSGADERRDKMRQ